MSPETKAVLGSILKWIAGIAATILTMWLYWATTTLVDIDKRVAKIETEVDIRHQ